MKRVFVTLLTCFLMFQPIFLYAEGEESEETEQTTQTTTLGPDIKAPSGILIDAETGTVLAKKNSDQLYDPTSLTKIMSVYLGVENLKEDRSITMSKETFESYDHTKNVIWIMENETISFVDCAYASLVQNANDTTAMIAEAVSGNQDAFVEKMNATAEELGLINTHFSNVFGSYAEDQKTTAEDMAVLTRKAIRNKLFKEAFGASGHRIAPTAQQPNARVLANNCEFLRDGTQKYEAAVGCKIGYNQESGFALSAVAEQNGMELIAIILGGENENACYEDARTLFAYGFSEYQMLSISPQDIGTKTIEVKEGDKQIADVTFKVDQGFSVLLPSSIDKEALQSGIVVYNETSSNPKDIYAEVQFKLNGELIGTAEMQKETMAYGATLTSPEFPDLRKIFDYGCIGILFLLVFYRVGRILMPPQ